MNPRIQLHPQQFARGPFERGVRSVRVGPFDQHAFALDRTGRRDGRCRHVAAHVQTRNVRVVGKVRSLERRIVDVNGVEASVRPVVGIELDAHQSAGETGVERELVEDARAAGAAVEIKIGREGARRFVEDVQRAVEIVDEESIRSARLLLQRVDAREHAVSLALAVEKPGDRHRGIVLELERDRRRAGGRTQHG